MTRSARAGTRTQAAPRADGRSLTEVVRRRSVATILVGEGPTTFDSVTEQLGRVADVDAVFASMTTDVRRLSAGVQGSVDGLRGIGSAAEDMRSGMAGLQTN